MKKLFTIMATVLLTASLFAQAPQKMSYQAVVRDASGQLVTTQIRIQISIFKENSDVGNYSETQTPTPNANGLITIEIGGADPESFSYIDWSNGPYSLTTAIDPDGGTNYTIIGTSQILSVPYALHAKTAESITGTITESQISDLYHFTNADETDPSVPIGTSPGEMQYWNGTAWVTVAPGSTGQTLTFVNGVPVWVGTPLTNVAINPTTGEIWMDRNLGASQVATSSTDAASYGDLYQWGRGPDGHELRTSLTTSTNATTAVPSAGNTWDGLFITEGSTPYDWLTPQDDNLWQGVSSTNNPCPSGYRLPTEAEWEAERTSWSSNNSAGAFASPLKLPVAGSRGYSNGSLYNVGSFGRYWSSTVSSTYSRYLGFSSSDALMSSNGRANGYSVRCLKD